MPWVYICDDDYAYRQVLETSLMGAGYFAASVNDAKELERLFRVGTPALVVLDFQVPGGGAPRAMACIPNSVPVIMISGMSVQHQRQWFAGREMVRFFQKPFSLPALLETVCELRALSKETERS